jgi:hypothetical protein
MHATGGHAFVARIDHHCHAARMKVIVNAAGNLGRHLLLHLEASRVSIDDACKLADTDHAISGQVTHVCATDDWRHVVLAVTFEFNVAQHHHLVVTGHFLEGAAQVLARIDLVAAEPIFIGFDDAPGRIDQTLA